MGTRSLASLAAPPLALLAGTSSASAHVKWFCAYDVAGQPRGLEQVLCADFEWLAGLAILCLMFGCLAEGTPLGGALLNALDRVTTQIRTDTELLVRATLGFFFVSLWGMGGIILTPELKTDVDAIGHSGIIVVLLGIAADDMRTAVRVRDITWAPAYYGGALATFLALYYVGHEALYEGLTG
ncbi:hypothetical protein FV233_28135, partial [Methylobacterium sp. WL7]